MTSVPLRIPLSLQQDASMTQKRVQLLTRSGLPRLRCCVCHIHHKCALKSPAAAREFFKTVLQQMCHIKVDANAASDKYYKSRVPRSVQSSCDVMLRCNVRSTWDSHLQASFKLRILRMIIPLNLTQQMIFIVVFWPFSHGVIQSGPES